MLIAGRDVPGEHALALVLRKLVVTIGNLKPVAGSEQIDVESVARARLPIEAIEDRAVVSDVVDRQWLGGVEKMSGANAIDENKIPILRTAESQGRAAAPGSEGAPVGS